MVIAIFLWFSYGVSPGSVPKPPPRPPASNDVPGSDAPVLVDQPQVAGLHVVLGHFEAARGVQNGHLGESHGKSAKMAMSWENP